MISLRLTMLGGFQIQDASGTGMDIPSTKAALILACLALRPGEPRTREKLMALLWSDRGESQARASLRHAGWALRRAVGGLDPCPLLVQGESLALDPATVDTDVLALERYAADGSPDALEAAVALCHGEFLEGVRIRDRAVEEFLRIEQERVQELTVDVCGRLMDH